MSRNFLSLLFATWILVGCQTAVPSKQVKEEFAPGGDLTSSPRDSSTAPDSVRWIELIADGPDNRRMYLRFDGMIEAGSDPQNRIFLGFIHEAELEAVNHLIVSALVSLTPGAHEKSASGPAIEVRTPDGVMALDHLYREEAASGYAFLSQLLGKYDASTLSPPCRDILLDFQSEYRSLLSCETNEDCSYIGPEFLPIEADHQSELITDDCTYLRPLLTANAFEVVSRQLRLLLRKDLVTRVCGNELKRPYCQSPRRSNVTNAPPLCRGGRCLAHPTLHF